MKLGDICEIGSGHTSRGRLEVSPEGGRLAVQLRDIQPDDDLAVRPLQRYLLDDLPERHVVRGEK